MSGLRQCLAHSRHLYQRRQTKGISRGASGLGGDGGTGAVFWPSPGLATPGSLPWGQHPLTSPPTGPPGKWFVQDQGVSWNVDVQA